MRRSFRYPLLVVALCITAAFMIVAHHAAHPAQQVLITFEGPWAFAADPSDATKIFAFAPKTTSHHDLVVKYSADKSAEMPLAAGVYRVSLKATPVARPQTGVDSKILQAKIDAKGVQHALSAGDRYAILLPRPEAYVSTSAGRMRAGTAYPPGPSTEGNYAMTVSLRYSAPTLAGFAVTGSPDGGGVFRPLPVETAKLDFAIRPLMRVMDECEIHNREAFRDLARLVNLEMFVDFEEYRRACQAVDPQNPAIN